MDFSTVSPLTWNMVSGYSNAKIKNELNKPQVLDQLGRDILQNKNSISRNLACRVINCLIEEKQINSTIFEQFISNVIESGTFSNEARELTFFTKNEFSKLDKNNAILKLIHNSINNNKEEVAVILLGELDAIFLLANYKPLIEFAKKNQSYDLLLEILKFIDYPEVQEEKEKQIIFYKIYSFFNFDKSLIDSIKLFVSIGHFENIDKLYQNLFKILNTIKINEDPANINSYAKPIGKSQAIEILALLKNKEISEFLNILNRFGDIPFNEIKELASLEDFKLIKSLIVFYKYDFKTNLITAVNYVQKNKIFENNKEKQLAFFKIFQSFDYDKNLTDSIIEYVNSDKFNEKNIHNFSRLLSYLNYTNFSKSFSNTEKVNKIFQLNEIEYILEELKKIPHNFLHYGKLVAIAILLNENKLNHLMEIFTMIINIINNKDSDTEVLQDELIRFITSLDNKALTENIFLFFFTIKPSIIEMKIDSLDFGSNFLILKKENFNSLSEKIFLEISDNRTAFDEFQFSKLYSLRNCNDPNTLIKNSESLQHLLFLASFASLEPNVKKYPSPSEQIINSFLIQKENWGTKVYRTDQTDFGIAMYQGTMNVAGALDEKCWNFEQIIKYLGYQRRMAAEKQIRFGGYGLIRSRRENMGGSVVTFLKDTYEELGIRLKNYVQKWEKEKSHAIDIHGDLEGLRTITVMGEIKGEKIPLSVYYLANKKPYQIEHTASEQIPKLMEYIEELFYQTIQKEDNSELLEDLGRLFWWICQAKPWYLGEPSIAEMLIKGIWLHKTGDLLPSWQKDIIPWEKVMEEPDVEIFAKNFHQLFNFEKK